MADDTTGTTGAGGSNPEHEPGVFTPPPKGPTPGPSGFPEPQILSETVSEPDASMVPPKPVPKAPVLETPIPNTVTTTAAPPDPAFTGMMTMPKIPPPPVTAMSPQSAAPNVGQPTSAEKVPVVPTPAITTMPKTPQDIPPEPDVGLPRMKQQNTQTQPLPAFTTMPKVTPGPTITAQPGFRPPERAKAPDIVDPAIIKNQDKMSADISKILKGVKLPERQEMKGAGDMTAQPAKKIAVPNISDAALQSAPAPKELREIPVGASSDQSPVVAMHTLKDDIKNVVLEKKISIIRAASLEQDRHKEEGGDVETRRTTGRSFGILFASVLFIFLGLAALGGVYVVEMGRSGTTQSYSDSLVFSEQSLLVPIQGLSPQGLKSQIASARQATGGALGSITRLIPVTVVTDVDSKQKTQLATTAEFWRALGTHAPDELVRSLADNFFFGIHTVDKNAPVLVVPVTSYDHAFAGMLQWESDMNGDLAPIFTKAADTVLGADGTPSKRQFQDAIMRNYDVRALKDDSGNIILYYSFPTPKILIIAESPYSFNELLNRLQAQRQL